MLKNIDRPNKHPLDAKSQVGYKHVPKDKILSMIHKFDIVKPKYEKIIMVHDPSELVKLIDNL